MAPPHLFLSFMGSNGGHESATAVGSVYDARVPGSTTVVMVLMEAEARGPPVQALGGGRMALAPSRRPPSPGAWTSRRSRRVSDGPDGVVGQGSLGLGVDDACPQGHRALGTPQHSHFMFLLEPLIGGGLWCGAQGTVAGSCGSCCQ